MLAATSEACLRRCLTTCPDKGQAGDEACLRRCLKDCPVHCGTVDMDCALDCLKRTPAVPDAETSAAVGEPWEATSRRSPAALRVSGCAESCTVKPECRPTSYDSGPAELSGAAKAPHARQTPQTRQNESGPEREKRVEPKGRSFSLLAPQGWTMQEQDTLPTAGDQELVFLAKGAALLDYAQISVRYVPGPHRTAARFRFDLEHPANVMANATATVMTRSDLSGAVAWRAESRSVRSLLGLGDSVPILKRTLLLPQDVGYFVLALETPEVTAEANAEVFERLAGSFRPQLKASARGPELSAQERAVWAGFFRSGGKVERAGRKGQGAGKGMGKSADGSAPPEIEPDFGQPQQYLTDTARTRLVTGQTLAAPALDQGVLAGLLRGCGVLAPETPNTPNSPDRPDSPGTDLPAAQALNQVQALTQALTHAWDAVRGQQVLVTDEIFLPGRGVNGLNVQEKPQPARGGAALHELKAEPARQGRLSRPGGPQGFQGLAHYGGVASLSRVAFSADGALALAYVAHGQTSPGTSHFLLLRRVADDFDGSGASGGFAALGGGSGGGSGGHWTLCGAAQRDMLIY
ncbi:MAG: hypothetical protein Q8S17_11450 [Humidesulfovibrio sp.]|nr:hypothetical protein [Humidesulfovibrio sp.]